MINQPETFSKRNANFWEWLIGINTLKISSNSNRVLKLGPRWLLLGIISLNPAVGEESLPWAFLGFVCCFFIFGFIWYIFDRLRGKTKYKID
jgi:hypothetical protein